MGCVPSYPYERMEYDRYLMYDDPYYDGYYRCAPWYAGPQYWRNRLSSYGYGYDRGMYSGAGPEYLGGQMALVPYRGYITGATPYVAGDMNMYGYNGYNDGGYRMRRVAMW